MSFQFELKKSKNEAEPLNQWENRRDRRSPAAVQQGEFSVEAAATGGFRFRDPAMRIFPKRGRYRGNAAIASPHSLTRTAADGGYGVGTKRGRTYSSLLHI
jgi:hypothetical protein